MGLISTTASTLHGEVQRRRAAAEAGCSGGGHCQDGDRGERGVVLPSRVKIVHRCRTVCHLVHTQPVERLYRLLRGGRASPPGLLPLHSPCSRGSVDIQHFKSLLRVGSRADARRIRRLLLEPVHALLELRVEQLSRRDGLLRGIDDTAGKHRVQSLCKASATCMTTMHDLHPLPQHMASAFFGGPVPNGNGQKDNNHPPRRHLAARRTRGYLYLPELPRREI
jgi:hypothetical protein